MKVNLLRTGRGRGGQDTTAWDAAEKLDPTVLEVYLTIAEGPRKKGHLPEAPRVLERGLRRIDPENERLRAEVVRIPALQNQ